MLSIGFVSPEHRAVFEEKRDQVRRGGPQQSVCGARTRSGAPCRQPPVFGFRRCLCHGGPPVARAVRERQCEAVSKGQMSIDEFLVFEARRAANRQRYVWRKHPWEHGATIALGKHEQRFAGDVQAFGLRLDTTAPSVLDTARWRFRRLMVDRSDPEAWNRWLSQQAPRLVQLAGPMPEDWTPAADGTRTATLTEPTFVVRGPANGSKRAFADNEHPRRPRKSPVAPVVDASDDELFAFLTANARSLAPLLSRCVTDGERLDLARALKAFSERPTDLAAFRHWADMVRGLKGR